MPTAQMSTCRLVAEQVAQAVAWYLEAVAECSCDPDSRRYDPDCMVATARDRMHAAARDVLDLT